MRPIIPVSAALLLLTAAPAVAIGAPDGVLYTVVGAEGGYFGWAVSELADVDGDGVTDWISGAPFDPVPSVSVHSGATGAELWTVHGDPGTYLSYAIADVGDVDGDGTHDVAAGDIWADRVLVLDGSDGSVLHDLTDGEPAWTLFGHSVGDAGDVDGDGHDDLLVGAMFAGAGGEAYVYSGADGSRLRTYAGADDGDWFGSGTDAVGDVDGDGVVDHVIGAANGGPSDGGAVHVFSGADGALVHELVGVGTSVNLGRFFVAGLDDVDGDGVADVYGGDYGDNRGNRSTERADGNETAMERRADPSEGRLATGRAYVWSGATGERLHVFNGASRGAGMGPGRGAGDVDGDGHEDVVVGSYTSSVGAEQAGQVTVFSGATGDVLLDVVNDVPFEQLGFDAVGLGDLDGDGRDDLLVSGAEGDRVHGLATGTG